MNELIELQKETEELRWLGVMVLWSILVILLVWENRNPNQKPRLNHNDDKA